MARRSRCANCKRRDYVHRHHLVQEQTVKHRHGDPDDPRNTVDLCVKCHGSHHQYGVRDTRLPFSIVPKEAREFAIELFGGEAAALDYWRRRYVDVPVEEILKEEK